MNHNPEIEAVITNATEIARKFNHEYVTLEHLTYGLVSYKPFYDLVVAFGADADSMIKDLEGYLSQQTSIVSPIDDAVPKKTHALERTFNRAFTQVIFSNRNHFF